jgi:hypothetical protein
MSSVGIRVLRGSVAIVVVLLQGRDDGLEAQNKTAQFGQRGGKLGFRDCGRAGLAGREIVDKKRCQMPAERAPKRRGAGLGAGGQHPIQIGRCLGHLRVTRHDQGRL